MINTLCGNETRRAKCVRSRKESKELMYSTPPLQEQQTARAFGLPIPLPQNQVILLTDGSNFILNALGSFLFPLPSCYSC